MKKTIILLSDISELSLEVLENAIQTVGLSKDSFSLVYDSGTTHLGMDNDMNSEHISVIMLVSFLKTILKPAL